VLVQLAITCICDHYTRVIAGGSRQSDSAVVIGLLFGSAASGSVEVVDATDAVYGRSAAGNIAFDIPEMEKKIALWASIRTGQKLLGWYTFGVRVDESHLRVHSEVFPTM
jgi:hypothetical protein